MKTQRPIGWHKRFAYDLGILFHYISWSRSQEKVNIKNTTDRPKRYSRCRLQYHI